MRPKSTHSSGKGAERACLGLYISSWPKVFINKLQGKKDKNFPVLK
jgi:hypothetical protein